MAAWMKRIALVQKICYDSSHNVLHNYALAT